MNFISHNLSQVTWIYF